MGGRCLSERARTCVRWGQARITSPPDPDVLKRGQWGAIRRTPTSPLGADARLHHGDDYLLDVWCRSCGQSRQKKDLSTLGGLAPPRRRGTVSLLSPASLSPHTPRRSCSHNCFSGRTDRSSGYLCLA